MLDKILSLRNSPIHTRYFISRIRGLLDAGLDAATPDPVRTQHTLFPTAGIDVALPKVGRDMIGEVIPHRGEMLLLDYIAWVDDDFRRGLAVKKIREDEFWVAGHFPGHPIMPGALMLEASAQLALYLSNRRLAEPAVGLFVRIENARFRSTAEPGDELLILCENVEQARNIFYYDVQGLIKDRIVFESRIVGLLSKAKKK
ncbi:3-hydroxyacyl-ACP dehydratase FabZ family protein [Methylocaldum marinum]|nr:3-hydroxyacyl-ACP dehydratase FabZ family protein [Methylocaldum marinum]